MQLDDTVTPSDVDPLWLSPALVVRMNSALDAHRHWYRHHRATPPSGDDLHLFGCASRFQSTKQKPIQTEACASSHCNMRLLRKFFAFDRLVMIQSRE